jgi:G3E family GTPase
MDRPLVVHGVQHLFHPPALLDAWPDEDRSSRLVFITRDLVRETFERTLKEFTEGGPSTAVELARPGGDDRGRL